MISQKFSEGEVRSILIKKDEWYPFPTIDKRDDWDSIRESIRKAHISRGEKMLGYEWPTILAVRFLDFVRTGNRSKFEQVSMGRRNALVSLVIAECMENQGRFIDDIVNGTWAICEESFWGLSAHIGAQKAGSGLPDITEPIVDLFSAETSALLSWVVYLLGSKLDVISKLVIPRIELEIDRRMLTPLMERDDFGWMGFDGQRVNNWNPWICSNWLTSALLTEKDEERRLKLVYKAIKALDNFIDPYPKDGGCDEGPSYWGRAGASLYDCLELLYSATDGKINVYNEPLIQNIGKFIYRVQIHDRYFINFADAPAMLVPSPALVYGYGKRINDPKMMALGRWSANELDIKENGVGDSIGRMLPALFSIEEVFSADAKPPLPRDVWLDEIQVMVARDKDGSSDGFFVAMKGGHNAESHNHNDVGNFIVYIDGKPVIIDAGVEAYTAKTFSSRRYEIWTMQSNYHNLPTINGVQQLAGYQYSAKDVKYQSDDKKAELVMDIAKAYPNDANLNSWIKSVILNRGENITINETYDLKEISGDIILNLLTPCEIVTKDGLIELKETRLSSDRMSGSAKISYESDKLSVFIEQVVIEDGRLKNIWGEKLSRIMLKVNASHKKDTLKLMIVK
ncbi:TPA: heparinase [bacterium]|nr:heparinase [bacterium]